jgi:hypothetical protein
MDKKNSQQAPQGFTKTRHTIQRNRRVWIDTEPSLDAWTYANHTSASELADILKGA